MKKEEKIKWARILLVIILLIFVWLNAHWSVSIFLTLASIRFELEDWNTNKLTN